MKKAVILCILFSVLLLSGCKGGQEEIQEFPDTPTPEYDAQNQYLLMNLMNFQETEDFFCGTDYGGMRLRYCDKKAACPGCCARTRPAPMTQVTVGQISALAHRYRSMTENSTG